MSINYDYTRPLSAESSGKIQEHYYRYENFDNGTGIGVLFQYAAFVSQIIASWENSTNMVLSVQLPSGVEFDIKTYSSATFFILNHLGGGSNDFMYWFKLPQGARLRLGVDSGDNAPGDLTISLVSKTI